MTPAELFQRLKHEIHSTTGKNALIFLVFLCVSSVFWMLLALNDEIQREFYIPVELTEVPDGVTLISSPPQSINVSVKDKGGALMRYQWGGTPPIKLRFKDFKCSDGRIVMAGTQISSVVRSYFGAGAVISVTKPDSIAIAYTTRPGRLLPVKLNIEVHTDPSYVINGPITISNDSVRIYSADDIPVTFACVDTYPSAHSDLTDTTTVMVKVKVPSGMRAIPAAVSVTIPVEPLISKTRMVPIEVVNVPADKSVITFPSEVGVSYLIPMSQYNNDFPVKAYADYNKISPLRSVTKIPVALPSLPDSYRSAVLSTDSVEYVIEQK